MKKLIQAAIAVATVVAVSAPAQAQTWKQSGSDWVPNNNNVPFWDHESSDGTHCNIGYVVTGVAGTAGNGCSNQSVASWLPYTGPAVNNNWSGNSQGAATFMFGAGTYSFQQSVGLGGDIASGNKTWGYYTGASGSEVRTVMPNSINQLVNYQVTFTGTWGLYIDIGSSAFRYSGANDYFAVFSDRVMTASSGAFNTAVGDHFVVGMEDTNNGDSDYNDVVVSFSRVSTQVVPEPSTYALMAAGLVALGFVSRRRRNADLA